MHNPGCCHCNHHTGNCGNQNLFHAFLKSVILLPQLRPYHTSSLFIACLNCVCEILIVTGLPQKGQKGDQRSFTPVSQGEYPVLYSITPVRISGTGTFITAKNGLFHRSHRFLPALPRSSAEASSSVVPPNGHIQSRERSSPGMPEPPTRYTEHTAVARA